MVDTGILATTAQIQYKAGANASSTSKAEGYTNTYVAMAEGVINTMTKYNWCDAYSSLNTDVKGILADAASNLAAMYVINYDMSGFSSRQEAETMLDVLYNGFTRDIEILKEIKNQDFMIGA